LLGVVCLGRRGVLLRGVVVVVVRGAGTVGWIRL
jgi:hypothetical protein